MTVLPDWDLQKAIYAALTAASPLTSLLAAGSSSIYDHVPAQSAYPYVVIGDMTASPHAAVGMEGRDALCDILVFSRAAGYREVKVIMAATAAALDDATLVLDGHDVVLCRLTASEVAPEDAGDIRRGRLRFRVITEVSGS